MSKFTITCSEFRPLKRNTLAGFCNVTITELQLQIAGVAIHQKNDKRWAQLPARPQLNKDGTAIRGDDGKVVYVPVLSFANRAVADAFSARVVESLVENYDDVFGTEESAS